MFAIFVMKDKRRVVRPIPSGTSHACALSYLPSDLWYDLSLILILHT